MVSQLPEEDTEELSVAIDLGRTRLSRDDAECLVEGSLLPLVQLTEEPVEVYVDQRLVARGEIVICSDKFCVRVTELVGHVNAVV